MPAVSILMTCYNSEAFLVEALESLQHQTFEDIEIVVVDDGSTDGTPSILQGVSARDGRLRMLSYDHMGIVGALQAGLLDCRAPYVARMDADDRAHPERIQKQLDFLEARPQVAVVGCLVTGFPPDQVRQGFRIYIDWLNSLVSEEDIAREIFVESPLVHPSVMYRRALVEEVGGYQDHGWPEDYDLWLRLFLAGASFAKVPEVLLEWREYPQRLTRTDSRYSLENFLRLKAHYLARGPLSESRTVIIWGAGMMGRRLSKHLQRQGCPLAAFIDVDPRKIGRTRRGLPVLPPGELPSLWKNASQPALLAAVGARGARPIIRSQLKAMGFQEGRDWWFAA